MRRNAAARMLSLDRPPLYDRPSPVSMLDAQKDAIAALLGEDAEAPATVIIKHLRLAGYRGGLTILKQYLAEVRPQLLAKTLPAHHLPARGLGQFGWWHTAVQVPIGKGHLREAFEFVGNVPLGWPRRRLNLLPHHGRILRRLRGHPLPVSGVLRTAVFDNDGVHRVPRAGLEESLADLVFDFSDLPEGLQAAVQLTHLQTEGGLKKAIAGATRRYAGEAKGQPAGTRWLREWADRLSRTLPGVRTGTGTRMIFWCSHASHPPSMVFRRADASR
jgi:hypothetical protein